MGTSLFRRLASPGTFRLCVWVLLCSLATSFSSPGVFAGEPAPHKHDSGGGHVLEGRDIAAVWCSACHQISPALKDPGIGPPFMELSGKLSLTRDFIVDWIAHNNDHVMPDFRLPLAVREDIANYILSLRDPELLARELEGLAPAAGGPAAGGLPDDSAGGPETPGTGPNMAAAEPGAPYGDTPVVGSSSGFYVSREGYAVTVAHGVRGCSRLYLHHGGMRNPAELIGFNTDTDVAVVKSAPTVQVARLVDNDAELDDGLPVVSFGFPVPHVLSSDGVMSLGYVNATNGARDNPEQMQVSVPALPGSSGSAVVNREGRVVGMITGRINRHLLAAEDQHFIGDITFATKATAIRALLRRYAVPFAEGDDGTAGSLESIKRAAVRIVCETFPS